MKILYFEARGEWYKVKEDGSMLQKNNAYNEWSQDWKLLGVSHHHAKNYTDTSVSEIFENPEKMINGYVFDIDHGTVRKWGGCYNGHLPRVESAYIQYD